MWESLACQHALSWHAKRTCRNKHVFTGHTLSFAFCNAAKLKCYFAQAMNCFDPQSLRFKYTFRKIIWLHAIAIIIKYKNLKPTHSTLLTSRFTHCKRKMAVRRVSCFPDRGKFTVKRALEGAIYRSGGAGNNCLNLNFRQNFPYVYTGFYKYR